MPTDLLTVARVKELASIAVATTTYDALLATLVTQVSVQATKFMDREPFSDSRTEILDIHGPGARQLFRLSAYPVTTLTSVHYDPDRAFAAATLLSTQDYALLRNGTMGELMVLASLSPYPSALKVVYTGGMAADTTAFVSAFPDISGALAHQVVFLFQRRQDIGLQSIGGDGGSLSHFAPVNFLPLVKQVLSRYRRYT